MVTEVGPWSVSMHERPPSPAFPDMAMLQGAICIWSREPLPNDD